MPDEHGNPAGDELLAKAHALEGIALQLMQMHEQQARRVIEGRLLKAAKELLTECAELRAKAGAMPAAYGQGADEEPLKNLSLNPN